MARTIGGILAALLFGSIPLVLMGVGIWQAGLQHARITSAVETIGTIQTSRVHVSSDSDGTSYRPAVTYRFTVQGRDYQGEDVFPLRISSGERWAERIVDQFTPGQPATVYYAADDPYQAFLLKRYSFFPYAFALFPMLFIVLFVAAVLPSTAPDLAAAPQSLASGDYGWTHPAQGAFTPRLIVCSTLWHGVGVLACGHFFWFAEPPYGPFAIIGSIVYEGLGAYPLLALFNPLSTGRRFGATTVSVDTQELRRGDRVRVTVQQGVKRAVQVQSIDIALTYRYSKEDVHEFRHTLVEQQHALPGSTLEGEATLTIPVDFPASKTDEQTDTGWQFEVICTRVGGGTYRSRFPLIVT